MPLCSYGIELESGYEDSGGGVTLLKAFQLKRKWAHEADSKMWCFL